MPPAESKTYQSLARSVCPNLQTLYIFSTVPVADQDLQYLFEMITPKLSTIYVCGASGVRALSVDVNKRRKVGEEPAEEEVEEKEEKEEKGTPDLEVKNNGIEIKMWMKCEEGSCVLDVERSGSYDSFNDLTDCETSVKVKCRNQEYMVPTPLSVHKDTLKPFVICVCVATVCER